MALETQGKLQEIFDPQQVTERFKKREFVVEIDDNGYLQHVKFQLNQDKCSLVDAYQIGDQIKVSFNLTGRQFTRKTGELDYITNVVAWRLERLGAGAGASASAAPMPTEPPAFNIGTADGADDSLPF